MNHSSQYMEFVAYVWFSQFTSPTDPSQTTVENQETLDNPFDPIYNYSIMYEQDLNQD